MDDTAPSQRSENISLLSRMKIVSPCAAIDGEGWQGVRKHSRSEPPCGSLRLVDLVHAVSTASERGLWNLLKNALEVLGAKNSKNITGQENNS